MIRKSLVILSIAGLISSTAFAHGHKEEKIDAKKVQKTVKSILNNIVADNNGFVKSHDHGYFAPFQDGQKPRAIIITCSDSRVHDQAFDNTPDGDIFMIRDIGNQISTAPGSVEYGVKHLNASLIIIVGHVSCGAIKAGLDDYSTLEPDIKKELDTLKLTKGETVIDGVKENVNNQVKAAQALFADRIKAGGLVVVGAVYDFRNDLGQGEGKLVIINVNGETDPAKISKSPLLAAK